jgi:hypothetical protein
MQSDHRFARTKVSSKAARRIVTSVLVVPAFAALATLAVLGAPAAASVAVSNERIAVIDGPAAVGSCLNSSSGELERQVDDSYRAAAAAMGLSIPQATQNGDPRLLAQGSRDGLRLQFTYDLTVDANGDVTVQGVTIEQICGS